MKYVLTYTQGGFEGTETLVIEAPKLFGERDNEIVDALVKGTGWMSEDEARKIVKDHTYYLICVDGVDYKVEVA